MASRIYAFLLANNTAVDVTGNTFANIVNPDPATSATWGAGVRTYTPGSAFALNLDGNTFTDNAVGLGIRAGSDVAPGAITITHNVFNGNDNDIVNQGTATTDLAPSGNNTFDSVLLSGATDGQLLALADKMLDGVDMAGTGSVVLKAGHVYLTANSFFAPGTTAPSLQRAVDTAHDGDTIHVGAGAYSGTATTTVDNLTVTAPAGATGLALVLGTGVHNITLLDASNIDVTGNTLANTADRQRRSTRFARRRRRRRHHDRRHRQRHLRGRQCRRRGDGSGRARHDHGAGRGELHARRRTSRTSRSPALPRSMPPAISSTS